MRKHHRDGDLVVGIAWFDREQWERLCQVVPDRSQLDDSFEEWEASALRSLAEMKTRGLKVKSVSVQVSELVQWCDARKLPVDGAARAQYVSFLLQGKRGEA